MLKMNRKKIIFLSGTRADFGKLKSLIEITSQDEKFTVCIFATGMHMQQKYGNTVDEIVKSGFDNIFRFINHTSENSMDLTLAKTIEGLSNFIHEFNPDLIVVHGDRVEALAGAIVGALNNILVAHVEGGEISGTIDELLRHSISKISHTHFVSNDIAKKRLIQMGEIPDTIFVIGSPDIDAMNSDLLPSLENAKARYDIPFDKFGILLFHPVTTEHDEMLQHTKSVVEAVIQSGKNYIVIYPNNDLGSSYIFLEYRRLESNPKIKIFPSLRFEYFLVLLKNAEFIIGNSSAGIREAPYYGLPTINIGNRQQNRALHDDILNVDYNTKEILSAIEKVGTISFASIFPFGNGNSASEFYEILNSNTYWETKKQKMFMDLTIY